MSGKKMGRTVRTFSTKKDLEKVLNTFANVLDEIFPKQEIEVILLGGLAMISYGANCRTLDIDCELHGKTNFLLKQMQMLNQRLRNYNLPADIGEDVSCWSMINLPPGYQERKKLFLKKGLISFYVLHPLDLLISKLRIGRNQDFEDAKYLVRKFGLKKNEIKEMVRQTINVSPKSTEILRFKKVVQFFLKELESK